MDKLLDVGRQFNCVKTINNMIETNIKSDAYIRKLCKLLKSSLGFVSDPTECLHTIDSPTI